MLPTIIAASVVGRKKAVAIDTLSRNMKRRRTITATSMAIMIWPLRRSPASHCPTPGRNAEAVAASSGWTAETAEVVTRQMVNTGNPYSMTINGRNNGEG